MVGSSGALSFAKTPRRLAVIGTGVIGLELVWAGHGIQMMEEFILAGVRAVGCEELMVDVGVEMMRLYLFPEGQ